MAQAGAHMMLYGDALVDALVSNRVVVVSPHMDDETLACGGVMAMHGDKHQLFCVFATDGAKSPAPLLPWAGATAPDLPAIRRAEAEKALGEIGIPKGNLVFLDYADGRLKSRQREFVERLSAELIRIQPKLILVPFRFDRHPDHIAVHRAVRSLIRENRTAATVLEYFVYTHWRLVPGRDIRRLVTDERLVKVDIAAVAERKKKALAYYRSQNSICYPWQESPILTNESLRRRCAEPEYFLTSDAEERLLDCFPSRKYQILFAHYAERIGKRPKDQLAALFRSVMRRTGT